MNEPKPMKIDGVELVVGEQILEQWSDPVDNGVYVVTEVSEDGDCD